ncbi:MAG: hypothetical protein WBB17_05310, partial [Saprospiraceae bacterium]
MNWFKSLAFFGFCCFLTANLLAQGCLDIEAKAGPDLFTCDPSMPVQLQGETNADEYEWTPSTYLSNPKVLDPFVNAPPGKYKYTLKTKGLSSTNLITNGDFESGFAGFSTSYSYTTNLQPEGTCYVGPDPSAFHPGFEQCGDHTTGGGNQLVVNASINSGLNFLCKSVPVTAGKMYLFTFFLQNVIASNPGVISVTINGSSVGTISAGGSCAWFMFEHCFTAKSSTALICLSELSGVAGGNDFAVDDLSLYEKCEDMDEVMVEVVDLKAVVKAPILPDCSSEPFELKANGSSTGTNVRYEWTASNGGKILSSNGL